MFKKPTYSSAELIEMIQAGKSKKAKAIAFIFRHNRQKTLTYLKSKGATEAQADDLLQEGMLVLMRQLEKGVFEGKNEASVHTYFVGICKNLLRAEQRKKVYTQPLADGQDFTSESSAPDDFGEDEQQAELHRALKKLGEICREILLLRAETPPVPWQALAQKFGYKDAQNAMNKGGKCMKQLRKGFFEKGEGTTFD